MKRPIVIFLVFAVVVLACGFGVYQVWLTDPPPKPQVDAGSAVAGPVDAGQTDDDELELVPVEQPDTLVVAETRGTVERQGPEKNWVPVEPGDELGVDESIKTGLNSSAKLKLGEESEIAVAARSELSVREITSSVQRLELVRGKIGVDYSPEGARLLKIENTDSDAVALSEGGKFTILNTSGKVSVATTTGEVKLTAKNETVLVAAGQATRVLPDKPPEPVKPIPVAVLLRVAKPKRQVQRERHTVVRGKTDPGAQVRVNETVAKVDDKGRFWARVPLKSGRNKLVVVTEDVAGNTKTRELPPIIVDANAPIDDVNIRWKQKKDEGEPG